MARLGVAHKRLHNLSLQETALVSEVAKLLSSKQSLWTIPRMHGEVHDLHGLAQVGEKLLLDQE